MTLTEFLLARIAGDEQPDPEALKMDAHFSPSEDGFTVEYQWARLIHQASGLPVRQRRGSGLARGAPSPARVVADCTARRKIVARHANCGSGAGYCDEAGHAREGGGCAELADLATV
jgi:Family of unknown function (DUF6221)